MAALLHDRRPLSGIDPSDLSGAIVVLDITAIFFLIKSDDVIPIWEPALFFWGASFFFAVVGASLLHRLLAARSQAA